MSSEELQDLRLRLLQQLEQSHKEVRQLDAGLVGLTRLLLALNFTDDAQVDRAMRLAADVMTRGEDIAGVATQISGAISGARKAARAARRKEAVPE